MAIQLMCDSTAYLERNFLMEHKVKMIPLTYRFRGTDHREKRAVRMTASSMS